MHDPNVGESAREGEGKQGPTDLLPDDPNAVRACLNWTESEEG